MKLNRKAQSGLELIMMVSFTLLIFTSFYIILLKDNFNTITEQRNSEFQNIADRIGYELDIATSIGPGYSKNFTLPSTVLGLTYNIIIIENLVVLNTTQSYTSKIITKNITGTIDTGNNKIENRNGQIYANSY